MITFTEQVAKNDPYRVVLVLPWSKMVLAERHGNALRLRRIYVPQWTRKQSNSIATGTNQARQTITGRLISVVVE